MTRPHINFEALSAKLADTSVKLPREEQLRRAGVLVPLVDIGGDWHILLLRRADHLKHHAGQIGFPGGRMEADDANSLVTALREAEEEIALNENDVRILGRMPEIKTRTGFHVTPYLGIIREGTALTPDGNEIAGLHMLPLAWFLDHANHELRSILHKGERVGFRSFKTEAGEVWGATASIVTMLIELITGETLSLEGGDFLFWAGQVPVPLWAGRDALKSLITDYANEGVTMRLVGGIVRDSLMGLKTENADIDLAADAAVERVMDIAQKIGVKCVPTGVEHGSVTLVLEDGPVEVTSLRQDVETDGRHAKTAFIADWNADAARRDFTINAFYADFGGRYYDPVRGYEDLMQRHIRFIGTAEQRIQEDYLRMLRFMRFYAHYGKNPPDKEALSAIKKHAAQIKTLSAERIGHEILKLFSATNPCEAWSLMRQTKLADYIFPALAEDDMFKKMITLENKTTTLPDPLRRLAMLIGKKEDAVGTGKALRLSNQQIKRLTNMLQPSDNDSPLAARLYRHGKEAVIDRLWITAAETGQDAHELQNELEQAMTWARPVFPISGNDLQTLGLKPGRRLGSILKAVEDWWIAQNFTPDKPACIARAKALIKKN